MGQTGLHVGSVRRFGDSIGTLVTKDADMARKPAEVNVEDEALSDISLQMISSIMGWSILRWSSACRHDMESVKIKNLFLLECSMHFVP